MDTILIILVNFIIVLSILTLGYQAYSLQARKKAINEQERVTEERNTLLKSLNEYRDYVFQAVYSFSLLRDFSRYVSKIEYGNWLSEWGHFKSLLDYERHLSSIDLDFVDEVKELFEALKNGEKLIKENNKQYVLNELVTYKDFFDTIEEYPLTDSQRNAIVIDEKCNLIVAGAGTGKTSTIVGKAGYLIKSGQANPDDILLISYTTAAKKEMEDRIKSRLGRKLRVTTFHGLGRSIVSEVEGRAPSVSVLATDKAKLQKSIEETLERKSKDTDFLYRLNEYFGYNYAPYENVFNFRSKGEYYDYLRNHNIRSLKDDLVKSYEECSIANFLFLNGIDYEYEKKYEIDTATQEYRQYEPDFYLPEYGVYIEHFGVDRYGNPAPFFDKSKYLADMEWKRKIHRKNQTPLIATYSWWSNEGILLERLENELLAKGITFNKIPPEKIFEKLYTLGLVSPFSGLIETFLNLFKESGKTIPDLLNDSDKRPNASRYHSFLNIFKDVYSVYEENLGNEIDFNDMINKAKNYIHEGKFSSVYKYILVDEFQDISQSRYGLLKALVDQNPESKLFCVGDDWQSIFRFAGSDISIMTDFDDRFNPSEIPTLDKTFRFDNKLCEFSSKFILKNPNQITKKMTSYATSETPAVSLLWGNEYETEVSQILTELNDRREKASVFIIGRYNCQKPKQLNQYNLRNPNLTIKYITAHSSKGTQADYVIIDGLTSKGYAFPSQIFDDPILELVLAKKERIKNAEERRLFYVALTRARKQVFLVADKQHPSPFAVEIEKEGYEVEIKSKRSTSEGQCPECKTGVILHRKGEFGEFYSCSNYPYCTHKPRRCQRCNSGFLLEGDEEYYCSNERCGFKANKCPECEDGFLVERRGPYPTFYGCRNFPDCRFKKEKYKHSLITV